MDERSGSSAGVGRQKKLRRRLRLAAAACLLAAAGLFALHVAAWTTFPRVSPAVLPPAGEVLPGTAPFRFAYLADSRGNLDVLEVIFERVKADNVSLMLHGGDLVMEPATQDFEWLLHELEEAELGVPFCAVPGNHDIYEHGPDLATRYRLYSRSFGPRQYWFAYANTLFVAFDTACETCQDDDLRWLDRTLARLRDQYEACVVYTHTPPHDPRKGGSHCLRSGAEELGRILKAHRVTVLFASHIHSYLEDCVEGIPTFISGGAGAGRDEPILPFHYLLCRVEPGGAVRVERKDIVSGSSEDYWEHKLLVKLPRMIGLLPVLVLGGAGLLLLAVTLPVWRRRNPKRTEGAENGGEAPSGR